MPAVTLADLDQRPDLLKPVLALYAVATPGIDHLVCGLPSRMGLSPAEDDLEQAAGVLIALSGMRSVGALAIMPYGKDQVTLWGPVLAANALATQVPDMLLNEARRALRAGGFTSMRALVDVRNRRQRVLLQAHGFAAWKDNHCYERELVATEATPTPVRLAAAEDHRAVAAILIRAFPDSDHCFPDLEHRERQGFRHYVLQVDNRVVAVGAVEAGGRRSWLTMVATTQEYRGRHLGHQLLEGIIANEAGRGARAIGLEVLADNAPAIRLYESVGFRRSWTATVMTGPV
jgi:ribosomal protein S18 acetylase RimI-like enzyme